MRIETFKKLINFGAGRQFTFQKPTNAKPETVSGKRGRMDIYDYEDEIMRDKILLKFGGTKTFTWNREKDPEDVHHEEFYRDINTNYFKVENNLNFLVFDGCINKRIDQDGVERSSLTPKGIYVLSDIKKYGYKARQEKINREKITHYIIQIATLLLAAASLWATLYQISNSENNQKQERNRHHYKCCNRNN